MSRKQAVIVGSGFGGLASAIRLQARGVQTTLIESRDQLGGRAYVYRQDGFTFDGGPTVITAPFMIEELFTLAGRNVEDYVNIVPVDPFYEIRFHDGSSFHYNGDTRGMEQRIAALSPPDVEGYRRMLAHAQAIFHKGFTELADRPFSRFRDMLAIAPAMIRLGNYRTVYSFVSQYIQHPLLRRAFSFHPLLVGGNPFQTTSIYALIQYLEKQWGVHYVMGGTGALVDALGRLYRELGGQVILNQPVKRITLSGGSASGVETRDGVYYTADAVISNADVANTYLHLLPPEARHKYTDRKLARMKYSMSLFVIYFGTSRIYHDIKHHTILLSERYKELLADIFNRKRLSEDFSIYLHRPTATDPSIAPPGCDGFYALVPVPNQESGIDWTTEAQPFRNRVVEYLERTCLPDLSRNIVTERLMTPLDFETTLDSYRGSAFSFEPLFRQSAWFRPHNESEDVRNLYFAGAGTHPGAGIPGVLSSAKIVENMVCQQLLN